MVELPRPVYDEIVRHALEGWPEEVCGLIAGEGGVPVRLYRVANVAEHKPTRYVMDPGEQFHAMMAIEGEELELYGIYHSHPSTQAYPSETDRSLAFYPDAIYFICTLADKEHPALRAFNIVDDEVTEREIRITEPSLSTV